MNLRKVHELFLKKKEKMKRQRKKQKKTGQKQKKNRKLLRFFGVTGK